MFDIEKFMTYMKDTFGPMDDHFTYDMVENLARYAMAHKAHTKDELCYFLSNIIEEVRFGEVAMFEDDADLTSIGRAEKQEVLKELYPGSSGTESDEQAQSYPEPSEAELCERPVLPVSAVSSSRPAQLITEECRHCQSVVELRWNTDTQGFSAFCPVCGQQLLLCNECLRTDPRCHCDYDSKTDSCRRSKKNAKSFLVETSLGTIISQSSLDPDHPGIYIDLQKEEGGPQMALALVELCADEADQPEAKPKLITRVWGDGEQDEYTVRIIHENIEAFFEEG